VATSAETLRRPSVRRSTRALTMKIAALSAAAALLLGTGLSWRMTRGSDPALGPKAVTAASTTVPGKRIVKTVVVKRIRSAAASSSSGTGTTVSSAPVAPGSPAPVATSTS
jgi:hypothetical protein